MGMWTRGIAAVAGIGVGLAVLATGPAGSSFGAKALLEQVPEKFSINGLLHERSASDKQVVVERVVPASIAECWKMWTTTEGVGRFLTPNNTVELAVGGPFEVYFLPQNPEGQRGSEGCKILSYVPERMLSFEWNAPPHFPEVRARRSRVVVMFEEVPSGTKVELIHLGFGNTTQWNDVHEYFTLAWPQVMDRFADAARTT
ncbi:MAG: SRPBCC domain-containing protein [Phycisphaerales bacterium]